MALTPDALNSLLLGDLDALRDEHRLRARRPVRVLDAAHVEIDGRPFVNFASNNYLGLTHHPRLVAAARQAADRCGVGSGAAPLVSGYTDVHAAAERGLAAWKQTEDAVLLPSGYQASHAAVQAIAAVAERVGGGVRFLLDKLAHASLVDAARATGLPMRVFPHNGMAKLRRLLAASEPRSMQVVVTESIFSMDGDAADLPALAKVRREYPFVLLLDEAHGSGVYGPAGAGRAAEVGLAGLADLTLVTLSKAIGCVGGAICASRAWCETVVNHGRAYIFSTSLPPATAAAAAEALAVLRDEPHRQQRVRALAATVRRSLGLEGDSPIIPVILGSDEAALAAAAKLRDAGLLVPAIRPPTVPRGTSRLRVTVSSEHTDAEVSSLIDALTSLHAGNGA